MNKRGFTLIEIVMVIVVMGAASLGLVSVMQQVLISVHKPQVMLRATALAEAEAERVLNLPFGSEVDINCGVSPSVYTVVTMVDGCSGSEGINSRIVEIQVYHPALRREDNSGGYVWLAFLKTRYQ